MKKITKICLIAPTGSGKSTIAKIIEKKYNYKIIKLADPLYEIQSFIYKKLKIKEKGQDGELLQFLGDKIQRTSPDFLAKTFLNKVKGLVVNDDCRPHNYLFLKKKGFKFIFVDSTSRKRKTDHSLINKNHKIEWKKNEAKQKADFIIKNNSTISQLNVKVKKLMEDILND